MVQNLMPDQSPNPGGEPGAKITAVELYVPPDADRVSGAICAVSKLIVNGAPSLARVNMNVPLIAPLLVIENEPETAL